MPGTSTPCASNTAGTLTGESALYTASYSYDNLDRLTSGPAGAAYTYGDPAHLHGATSTSGGYSASYDASGDMTCRAPTSSTTCTGSSPTGAGLSYDNEGQLVGWTSALNGNPTPSRDTFAYDGEGARVAQQAVSGGVTTTTDYLLGGLEEVSSSGGTSTLTEYYPLPGIGTAVRVSTGSSTNTLSYLAGDGLGSVSVALDTNGTVTAQQLYDPYGTVRYSSGTMPTAHGYTGQLADAMTGLDDYGARYYDPALGQFTSADTVLAGLNRYAYVGGNPESATDPSGHVVEDGLEVGEQGAEDSSDLADSAGTGVPAAFVQAFGDAPVYVLDPTVTVTEGDTTTTYTQLSNGQIEANQVQTLTNSKGQITGTQMTTQYLRAGTWYYLAATQALNGAANEGVPAKIKSAYIPKGSGGQPSGGTGGQGGGSGSGAAPTSAPPATQTGSGGASGWGRGPNDPICGCGFDPSSFSRPLNSQGVPYPSFIDPRTGDEIPFPSGPLARVAKPLRTPYDSSGDRSAYIKQWYAHGYPTPAGGWSGTLWQIHHILPLEFGGTNDFWNMVPLSPSVHQQYTDWWKHFC